MKSLCTTSTGSSNSRRRMIQQLIHHPWIFGGCRYLNLPHRSSSSSSSGSTSSSNTSSSSNIQSQQRIKRFYKHVTVVEVDPTATTTAPTIRIPFPCAPPLQLGLFPPPPTTTTTKATTTTGTTSNDTTNQQQPEHPPTQQPPPPPPIAIQKWYTVTLDGKQLRTPSKQVLMVPSILLAQLIASEWNLVSSHIIPNQMPIMSFVCTVLDQMMHHNNNQLSNQHKQHFEQLCFQYVLTDTLGYPADPIDEPRLYQQQIKSWIPIQQWIQSSFLAATTSSSRSSSSSSSSSSGDNNNDDTNNSSSSGRLQLPSVLLPYHYLQQQQQLEEDFPEPTRTKDFTFPSVRISSMVQTIQYDPVTLTAIRQFISALDVWHLLALYIGCKECKSFWLSSALLITNSNRTNTTMFTPQQIHVAARMEEEMNISNWGFVDGQHDYDRLNSMIQLRAITIYIRALSSSVAPSSSSNEA